MKELKSLIRLKKWGLDERRRDKVELERLRDELVQSADALDAEMENERTFAQEADTPPPSFPNYLKSSLKKRAQLSRSIAQTEVKVAEVEEQITTEFEALKQAETALARAEEREAQKLKKIEQAELDEIASIGFHRGTAKAS